MNTRDVLMGNIRRLARERKIALNHLADRAGISRAGLYVVLKGTSAATIDILERIAEALSVEPSQLLLTRKTSAAYVATLDPQSISVLKEATTHSDASPKEQSFRLRLNETDRARLDALAAHYELPISSVLRILVKREIDAHSIHVAAARAKKVTKRSTVRTRKEK